MARTSRKRPRISIKTTSRENPPTCWFDLPLEMRESVINQMNIKTRCRFSECSKQCEDEVKNMKDFFINIVIGRESHAELSIGYSRSDLHYCMEFHRIDHLDEKQSIVVYKTVFRHSWGNDDGNRKQDVKWMKIEKGSAENVRMKYLNRISEKYQHKIGRIEIDDNRFTSIVDMSPRMEEMRNLRTIEASHVDVRKNGFMDLPFIIRTNHCVLEETRFTFEEVLQFQGAFYQIKSYDFDDENVEKYLKMWKNGELPKNMKYLSAGCDDYTSRVNCKRIAKSVDAFDYYEEDNSCEFRFLLNYERKSKCYCDVLYSSYIFTVQIETICYDDVMKKRQNFID